MVHNKIDVIQKCDQNWLSEPSETVTVLSTLYFEKLQIREISQNFLFPLF